MSVLKWNKDDCLSEKLLISQVSSSGSVAGASFRTETLRQKAASAPSVVQSNDIHGAGELQTNYPMCSLTTSVSG